MYCHSHIYSSKSFARLLIIYSVVFKMRYTLLEEEFELSKAKQGTDFCYSYSYKFTQ